ncbi:LuxR C-terminal-related transcriptional regulator [Microlunatus sp. GCM10028923]|uniref:helix-turn-helix transcriptional regulator n=1 Tax=Microlunatus sp. GCM10028923 TaxID=3273400 RepID=UPI00361F5B7C
MATTPRWARTTERIERICAARLNARELRLEVLAQLRTVIGFDAYAWLITDPETEVGGSPLADVPCLPELPTAIRLKYLTPVNRWTQLAGAAAGLWQVTEGNLDRSRFWRELLSQYGIDDVLSAVFRDRHGCWGFLDLWRAGGRFEPGEISFLARLAGPLARALRRAVALSFTADGPAFEGGPMILLLGPDLSVRAQTAPTSAALRLLVPPARDDAPIPAGAYNVAAQLLAREAAVDDHPAVARVHLDAGRWVTLRAARIGPDQPAGGDGDLAVSIERTGPAARAEVFGRSYGLSPRERQLLITLGGGPDTRDLAARLYLSEHTVQDHLRSIFDKTGLRSRSALVGRAFGP